MRSDQKSGLITRGVAPSFRFIYPKLQESSKSLQHRSGKMDFSLERALSAYLTELINFVKHTEKFSSRDDMSITSL